MIAATAARIPEWAQKSHTHTRARFGRVCDECAAAAQVRRRVWHGAKPHRIKPGRERRRVSADRASAAVAPDRAERGPAGRQSRRKGIRRGAGEHALAETPGSLRPCVQPKSTRAASRSRRARSSAAPFLSGHSRAKCLITHLTGLETTGLGSAQGTETRCSTSWT
jgi:hypothetical protein